MIPLMHKVNTVELLKSVNQEFGIEVDVRERCGKLIMQHDSFKDGELFEDLLINYKHKFMIVDIKCEGIEEAVVKLLDAYKIKDYFLLGITLPWAIKLVKKGMKNLSFHFSELEPIEQAKKLVGKIDWVWIDSYTHLPINDENYLFLSKNFKLCLGSPELYGRKEDIEKYKHVIKSMKIDAVCTDFPDMWI